MLMYLHVVVGVDPINSLDLGSMWSNAGGLGSTDLIDNWTLQSLGIV